jgi:diguanylate cyclase (GGDEF)-like protein/PAS domain S-box-containing protein
MKLGTKLTGGFLTVALFIGAVGVLSLMSNNIVQKNNQLGSEVRELVGLLDHSLIHLLQLVETESADDYYLQKSHLENERKDFDALNKKLHEENKKELQDLGFNIKVFIKDTDYFAKISNRLMAIHKRTLAKNKEYEEKHVLERELRRKIRKPILALQDLTLTDDIGFMQYRSKETLFQYKDQEHLDQWLERIQKIRNNPLVAPLPDVLNDLNSYKRISQDLGRIILEQKTIEAQERLAIGELQELINLLQEDEERIVNKIRAESKALARNTRLTMLSVIAGIFLLATVLGLTIARSISKPISILSQATKAIAGGDLTIRTEVESKDEIGELATSFNKMTEDLQKTTVSRDYVDNIIKSTMDSLIVADPDATIATVNQATLRLLGYEEKELIGQPVGIILAKEEEEAIFRGKGLDALIRKGFIANIEKSYLGKDGRRIPVLFSGSVMRDSEGRIQGIVCAATDISERKKHEEKLRRTSRALGAIHASNILLTCADDEQKLFDGICQNIVEQAGYLFVWVALQQDETGALLPAAWAGEEQDYINALERCRRVDELAGCPAVSAIRTGASYIEEDIRGASDSGAWHKEAAKRGYGSVIGLPLMREKEAFGALAIYSAGANSFEAEEVALLKELADELAYGVTALRTQQKHRQAEEQIAYQAFHDSLTHLPNRAMIMQSLGQAMAQIHRRGGAAAVLFIDLDEFKLVNDTLGHAAGDELLCQAAERLKSVVRGTDIVARQGGDEFIVLLARYGKRMVETELDQEAAIVAQKILEEMQKPFLVKDQEVYVSASIGISLFPDDAGEMELLIQHADSAMYRAKELGRGNYQFFSKELSDRQQKKMALATMLHKAIEQQEFVLYYQPVIDLANGRMVGVEALIRWEREKGNLISPADFLPVAEDTGLILPIGDWVIREACCQAREWSDKGISLEVAINLSTRQMWHGDIAGQALDIINETGVSKDMIEFEVTESAMVIDPERMDTILKCFQENGINMSLDDFGTGYSSLDRLKHLPFDKLKIDKSFVDGIPDDEDDAAIVTATVQMTRSLGLCSLAEGIETVEQWRFLKSLGCGLGQGYYFSKPVPATEIERLFEQNHHWEL